MDVWTTASALVATTDAVRRINKCACYKYSKAECCKWNKDVKTCVPRGERGAEGEFKKNENDVYCTMRMVHGKVEDQRIRTRTELCSVNEVAYEQESFNCKLGHEDEEVKCDGVWRSKSGRFE